MDSSSDKFSIAKLDVHNYATWSTRMKLLLIHKGVCQSVVTAPVPASETASDADRSTADKALLNDQRALALIGLSVEDCYLPTIGECTTAKAAWDTLAKMYTAQSNARLLQLKRQLSTLSLDPAEPLAKYVARAQAIRDQLKVAGSSLDDLDLVLAVLDGLPQEYDTVRTALLTASGDLKLADVLSKLLLVEQREVNDPNAALYVSVSRYGQHQGGGPPDYNRETRTCHYCKKQCHLIKDCRKKKAADEHAAQSNDLQTLALAADFDACGL